MIGTYGDIAFEIGGSRVFTFDRLSRRSAATFSRHQRAGDKPVLEFMGSDLSEITFSVHLSATLGVEPREAIEELLAVKDSGEEKQLIIGGHLIGNYVITEITDTWNQVTAKGRITSADVALTLLEAA